MWLRGFESMAARGAALPAFYGGPVWRAHRDTANATMVDSDDALLLEPRRLGPRYPRFGDDAPATSEALVAVTVAHLDRPLTAADLAVADRGGEAMAAAGADVVAVTSRTGRRTTSPRCRCATRTSSCGRRASTTQRRTGRSATGSRRHRGGRTRCSPRSTPLRAHRCSGCACSPPRGRSCGDARPLRPGHSRLLTRPPLPLSGDLSRWWLVVTRHQGYKSPLNGGRADSSAADASGAELRGPLGTRVGERAGGLGRGQVLAIDR